MLGNRSRAAAILLAVSLRTTCGVDCSDNVLFVMETASNSESTCSVHCLSAAVGGRSCREQIIRNGDKVSPFWACTTCAAPPPPPPLGPPLTPPIPADPVKAVVDSLQAVAAVTGGGVGMSSMVLHLQFLEFASRLCPSPHRNVSSATEYASMAESLEWTQFRFPLPWDIRGDGKGNGLAATRKRAAESVRSECSPEAIPQLLTVVSPTQIWNETSLYAQRMILICLIAAAARGVVTVVTRVAGRANHMPPLFAIFPRAELAGARVLLGLSSQFAGMTAGLRTLQGCAAGAMLLTPSVAFVLWTHTRILRQVDKGELCEFAPVSQASPSGSVFRTGWEATRNARLQSAALKKQSHAWVDTSSHVFSDRFAGGFEYVRPGRLGHVTEDLLVHLVACPFMFGLFVDTCFCACSRSAPGLVQHAGLLALLAVHAGRVLVHVPYKDRVVQCVQGGTSVGELLIVASSFVRSRTAADRRGLSTLVFAVSVVLLRLVALLILTARKLRVLWFTDDKAGLKGKLALLSGAAVRTTADKPSPDEEDAPQPVMMADSEEPDEDSDATGMSLLMMQTAERGEMQTFMTDELVQMAQAVGGHVNGVACERERAAPAMAYTGCTVEMTSVGTWQEGILSVEGTLGVAAGITGVALPKRPSTLAQAERRYTLTTDADEKRELLKIIQEMKSKLRPVPEAGGANPGNVTSAASEAARRARLKLKAVVSLSKGVGGRPQATTDSEDEWTRLRLRMNLSDV